MDKELKIKLDTIADEQCDHCLLQNKKLKTKECPIYNKLIKKHSQAALDNMHIWIDAAGRCKLYVDRHI